RMGAFDFLEKPFQLDALLRVVDRALGGAGEQPALTSDAVPASDASRMTAPRRIAQRTNARSGGVNGQGLHSGVRTGLILQPAPPGSGIVFESIATGEPGPALRAACG